MAVEKNGIDHVIMNEPSIGGEVTAKDGVQAAYNLIYRAENPFGLF